MSINIFTTPTPPPEVHAYNIFVFQLSASTASQPASQRQPATASYSQLQPATAPASQRQPEAARGSHRQPQAATESHRQPQAATGSHREPRAQATGPGHRPQAQAQACGSPTGRHEGQVRFFFLCFISQSAVRGAVAQAAAFGGPRLAIHTHKS